MTKEEALRLALEALKQIDEAMPFPVAKLAQAAIKEALAQPEQEPVAYDKTKMNCFVQDLYDKKMQEGKHGHYETMFHVVHQAIKRIPPQRTWIGLTEDEILSISADCASSHQHMDIHFARAIEVKLRSKNT